MGSFQFGVLCDLKQECNAPDDMCGIYLFYRENVSLKNLVYIGSSGYFKNDGSLNVRKSGCGGIKGRIVNGHQFDGRQRWQSLPDRMKNDGIENLIIVWYVTCDISTMHSPVYVESCLLQMYLDQNQKLPLWNLKF